MVQGALYDSEGKPRKPHRPCPVCDETRAIASLYDAAWCSHCGWRGSLSDLHAPAVFPNMITRLRNET